MAASRYPTSTPATAGSAEGTRLRCRASAAARSSRVRSDCTARRPVGGQLQQRGIIGGENPVPQRADMQHPQHRPLHQQRHAHQRPDALREQQRVEHSAVIDPVQDDRAPLGGDASRETPANRDPDTLTDFLLQAAGRSGDQLTARTVQQRKANA